MSHAAAAATTVPARLPRIGDLVAVRMSVTRSEPFAIGEVISEPILQQLPPQRTHTLTLKRSESTQPGGSAAAGPGRGAAAAASKADHEPEHHLLDEDMPLSQLLHHVRQSSQRVASRLSDGTGEKADAPDERERYFVEVHWFDLESTWVDKLKLLNDAHWRAQYTLHQAEDEAFAAKLGPGRTPMAAAWIVDQYRKAVFLRKPCCTAGTATALLSFSSLIAYGPREQLLTPTDCLNIAAFAIIREDLLETQHLVHTPKRHSTPSRRAHTESAAAVDDPVAAAITAGSATPAESDREPSSQSSVARRAALRSLEPPQSPAIAAAAAAGDARHTRSLRSPASAGSSTTNGSGTKRRRCNLEEPQVQQVPVVRVDADKSTPRRGRASAAAAAASATATATAAVQCDNCERLRACLFEQTQDLEAVRRLVCAIVDRAAPNAEAPL